MMEHLIVSIRLQNLRNEAHVEFNESAEEVMDRHDPETLGILPLFVPYKTAVGHETEALDILVGSDFTKKINRKDHQRDIIFRGLSDTVDAALHHFNAAHVDAAESIDRVLKQYGNVSRKPLDEETAAIDDLLREFQQEPLAQAAVRIGLTPWVEKLSQENLGFKELIRDRFHESASKTSYRMRTARSETDRYYHAIISRIEGDHLAGLPTDEAFIRDLNTVIEHYKHILAQEIGERPKPQDK
jgi:hypothetical protein